MLIKRIYIVLLCIAAFLLFSTKFSWLFSSNVNDSSMTTTTAIIVLGGGLLADGSIPEHTQLRLNRAFELHVPGKSKIVTLSGGSPQKPNPADAAGFPIWEASAAAKKLINMGVEPGEVIEEAFSLDTLGNAYFLRAVHVGPAGFSKLIVITNSWHMPRTRAMFERVFSLPPSSSSSPSSFSSSSSSSSSSLSSSSSHCHPFQLIDIQFVEVAPGLMEPVLSARIEREKQSLDTFISETSKQFHTFRELHEFMFSRHGAYASSRLLQERKPLDPNVLSTY